MAIILLGLVVLGGLIAVTVIAVRQGNGQSLIESKVKEKEENIKKVLALFAPGKQVSNNDVEQALGVSDATATRYLEELEKEGKIRQVGERGHQVKYELK